VQYICFADTLIPAGTTTTWKFALKITKVAPNASGAVEINPACECERFNADTNKSNDVAAIVLNPTATGGGGGSGGGGLPITGPQTALFGAAGAGLIAAGVAGFAIARRRRTRFEA